jgi:hypothetical protein
VSTWRLLSNAAAAAAAGERAAAAWSGGVARFVVAAQKYCRARAQRRIRTVCSSACICDGSDIVSPGGAQWGTAREGEVRATKHEEGRETALSAFAFLKRRCVFGTEVARALEEKKEDALARMRGQCCACSRAVEEEAAALFSVKAR